MTLTVLVPGIRVKNWLKLYTSVDVECEFIFISPYELPIALKKKKNVKLIKDWGSPMRCQQRGLCEAKGEYVTWAADDGYYLEGTLQKAIDMIRPNSLVMGKYIEGADNTIMPMSEVDYYVLRNHYPRDFRYINNKYYILNCGVVPTKMITDIGGWDCQFEVCPMAYTDLAIRLQDQGVEFIILEEVMFKCGHMPNQTGDHSPIHLAQTTHDDPLFKDIYKYGLKNTGDKKERIVELDNWKNSPDKWIRRFNT